LQSATERLTLSPKPSSPDLFSRWAKGRKSLSLWERDFRVRAFDIRRKQFSIASSVNEQNDMRITFELLQQNIFVQLYKHYIIESVLLVKRSGFRELIRQRGWKFLIAIVGYYLVRDTIVYIILPYCVAQKLF
jgi:hypothetical protein